MSTYAELLARMRWYLQDEQAESWDHTRLRVHLTQETTQLARQGLFGELVWVQAVAGRTTYQLDALGTFLTQGMATGGSFTTLDDSTVDFVALGLVPSMRVRNLTDGSAGLVSSVAPTTLTCELGFTGGLVNTVTAGDLYLLEAPISHTQMIRVAHVLYDGARLDYAAEASLDRLLTAWEQRSHAPRYWTVDQTESPTVLRIVPPPLATGSSTLVLPPVPFPLPWQGNLLVFLTVVPFGGDGETALTQLLPAWEDLVVWQTVGQLATFEGQHQDIALGQAATQLATLWRTLLEAPRYG